MPSVPSINLTHLPPFTDTEKGGAHGGIIHFTETDTIGKVVKKNSRGISFELTMELIARDRCGNDPEVNFMVPILALYNTATEIAIVMPNMKGGDLCTLLFNVMEKITLPPPKSVTYNIIRDFVTGVCLMHMNGLMHRDIKDANILLKEDGKGSLLCDFSLATVIQQKPGDMFVPYTKGYRPPEIVRYQKHKEMQLDIFAADIYATGSIIAKILMVMAGEWVCTGMAPNLSEMLASNSIAGETRDIIVWMMQDNPADRPTASQLMEHTACLRPKDYIKPMPFNVSPVPEIPLELANIVHIFGGCKIIARVAADIANTIKDTPELNGKRKYAMCVALAIKTCEAGDENETLPKKVFTATDIRNFSERAITSPEVISAMHRCLRANKVH